mmetsp:Transcript_72986/g.225690  ORF Transcript_72986/g.225690 Transcript_72986/m.225690 type:complete len:376 (+) Transcript_72986:80-1207(+)
MSGMTRPKKGSPLIAGAITATVPTTLAAFTAESADRLVSHRPPQPRWGTRSIPAAGTLRLAGAGCREVGVGDDLNSGTFKLANEFAQEGAELRGLGVDVLGPPPGHREVGERGAGGPARAGELLPQRGRLGAGLLPKDLEAPRDLDGRRGLRVRPLHGRAPAARGGAGGNVLRLLAEGRDVRGEHLHGVQHGLMHAPQVLHESRGQAFVRGGDLRHEDVQQGHFRVPWRLEERHPRQRVDVEAPHQRRGVRAPAARGGGSEVDEGAQADRVVEHHAEGHAALRVAQGGLDGGEASLQPAGEVRHNILEDHEPQALPHRRLLDVGQRQDLALGLPQLIRLATEALEESHLFRRRHRVGEDLAGLSTERLGTEVELL